MDAIGTSAKIAAQAAGQALSSIGIPGGDLAVDALLTHVLHIQDEQSAALSRIDAGVQLLLDSPANTAWQYVREAAVPHATPEDRRDRLRRAADKLHEAISTQPPRTFRRAFAFLDLALVEHILGNVDVAHLHALDATICAANYMHDVASGTVEPPRATTRTVLRGAQWGLRATASYVGYPTQTSLLREVDRATNQWLVSLYRELAALGNAAALLLGNERQQILEVVAGAPLDLTCSDGRIGHGDRVWASRRSAGAEGLGRPSVAITSTTRDD